MLSERQQRILNLVVDAYLESGKPVGSAAIAEDAEVEWGPSTVRAELAALEREGYLPTRTPPPGGCRPTPAIASTPTRCSSPAPRPGRRPGTLDLSRMRREIEEALRETTSALSRMTDLLAVATAPPPSAARIHRVEALQLQPRVVMVVVIASNGAVTKRVFNFAAAGRPRPGRVGVELSQRAPRRAGARRPDDRRPARRPRARPGRARRSWPRSATPSRASSARPPSDLYVEGAARLLSAEHAPDLPRADSLMRALERRANLLEVLRSTLDERSVFMWIGGENPAPELRSVSVVGANYGLGYRNLGTVGVVGPLRMDYATAIASVREAAGELSRFFESVYES